MKFKILVNIAFFALTVNLLYSSQSYQQTSETPMHGKRPAQALIQSIKLKTPPLKKVATEQQISPQKTTLATPNYCRNCITNLVIAQKQLESFSSTKAGNAQTANQAKLSYAQFEIKSLLKSLTDWHIQIPDHFFSVSWKAPDNQEKERYQEDFRIKLKTALLYQIFLCLANYNSPDLTNLPQLEPVQAGTQISITLAPFTITSTINTTEPKIRFNVKHDKNSKETIDPYDSHYVKDTFSQFFHQEPLKNADLNLQKILACIPKQLLVDEKGNAFKEKFYQTILIGMITFMGSCLTVPELYTGQGRSDIVIMSDEGNCIIELKYGDYGSAPQALTQIEEKNYMHWFGGKSQTVKALGINISRNNDFAVTCKEKLLQFTEPQVEKLSDSEWSTEIAL